MRSGNLVFINLVSFKNEALLNPEIIGIELDKKQAKEAVQATMLNVTSVLKATKHRLMSC